MNIAFALAAHIPDDERVRYQQAQALIEQKHEVFIISMTKKAQSDGNIFCFDYTNLSYSQKIENFYSFLSVVNPDAIICDNPISILAANRYKRKSPEKNIKIYYDITEWYPSKIHLYHRFFLVNWLKISLLMLISVFTAALVDGFIFGEHYKALPFRTLFFWKKHIDLTYYADIKHIKTYPINDISKNCTLFYAGYLTENYGFPAVLKCAEQVAKKFPETTFTLYIYSKDEEKIKIDLPNLKIDFHAFTPFLDFCKEFGKADIFFDLRKMDWENTRCLPIKLFYYMAAGRPVIYSDFKAIRKEVPEIEEFGALVKPKDMDKIVEKITQYIENQQLYEKHCKRARELAETKYNWGEIEKNFVDFAIN